MNENSANTSTDAPHRGASPVLQPIRGADLNFRGFVGRRIAANERNWLMTAPESNPAMIQMFLDRERVPGHDLLPWSGEFAGKYLTSAVEGYRLTRDHALKEEIKRFVADLVASQASDGYMGPFSMGSRMLGHGLWDLWGQYHCMLGLLRWYEETGDATAFAACRRTADYFCRFFLDETHRVWDADSYEMNESCIHVLALLYEKTGEPRYLRLVREIEKDISTPPSGNYIEGSLAGRPFYQLPKPRWEGLHAVEGVAELYFITGDDRYRRAFEQIWWTIDEFDRHNTGGFSSGEQAQGNPYDMGAIETCCTIAWMAISLDMLRMTGDSRVADELELSTFNAVFGAQQADGRWWTYNTPMNGDRKAGTQDIAFQARPGSPELSCCSVNGPRGIGMLSDWAVMSAPEGPVLNYFGPASFVLKTPAGRGLWIEERTRYPLQGRVLVAVSPDLPETFELRVRIPEWSARTGVKLNGSQVTGAVPGRYLALKRLWKPGDTLELNLDMSPRLWVGERESAGAASVYLGPILLAYDPRFDVYDPGALPKLNLAVVPKGAKPPAHTPAPWLLLRFATADGKGLTLCDFASAGAAGNRYVSWLPVDGVHPAAFTRANPMRIMWP